MQIILDKLKLKNEIDRLTILHCIGNLFLGLALFADFILDNFSFLSVIFLAGFVYFSFIIFQVKKKLYYSFWTFSFFLWIFILSRIGHYTFQAEYDFALTSYILSLIFHGIEIYVLSSPIYYPFVSWWEYDFRYRNDLKVKIKNEEGKEFDGRLVDLRRGAGCLASFEKFPIGSKLTAMTLDGVEVKCIIRSYRQYSLGRPYNYGVLFQVDGYEFLKSFNELKNTWNYRKSVLREKKLHRMK